MLNAGTLALNAVSDHGSDYVLVAGMNTTPRLKQTEIKNDISSIAYHPISVRLISDDC